MIGKLFACAVPKWLTPKNECHQYLMQKILSTLLLHPELTPIMQKTQLNPRFTQALTILLIGRSHFHNQSLLKVTKFAQTIYIIIIMSRVGTLVTQPEHLLNFFRQTQYHPDLLALLNLIFQNQFYSKALKSQVERQLLDGNGFV